MTTLNQISYHCFISYTTREEEVRLIQPFVDKFLHVLRAQQILVAPFFYDHLILENRNYPPHELREKLLQGIVESICEVSFVSEGYLSSPWCIFEWATMDGVQLYRGPKFSAILPIIWKSLINPGFVRTRDYIDLTSSTYRYGETPVQAPLDRTDLFKSVDKALYFIRKKKSEIEDNKDLCFDPKLERHIGWKVAFEEAIGDWY
jgi:hypothetical protein